MNKTFTLLLISLNCFSQKGGLNFPAMNQSQAVAQGYTLVTNSDSLIKYARIDNAKIFISKGFNLTQRCSVSGNNVIIQSDKKTITSNLWYSQPFRFFESFTIIGNNVTIQGLKLQGSDCDIRSLDTNIYQTAIRVYASDFHLINCELRCWGWCAVYFHRMQGGLLEQCYISQTMNAGYGYGIFFEGLKDQSAIVRDNIFEGCREAIDAGGQWTYWSATGNVTDRAIVSHEQPNHLAGIATTVSGNYFMQQWAGFPLPNDTGYLRITDNYFMSDSLSCIHITGVNDKARVDISNNHFNGEGMNLPVCTLRVDEIKTNTADFTIISDFKMCEIYYGDGTIPTFISSGVISHKYLVNGTYLVGVRTFDARGTPSKTVYQKIVIGSGLNFAFKTTARFNPSNGYYQIQLLIDDTIVSTYEASRSYSWKRISREVTLKGSHKISIRLACIKDCKYNILLFIDDFDYNGSIPNAIMESAYYQPPFSYWKYKAVNGTGNTVSLGAGLDYRDKCGGEKSWRFEYRPDSLPVKRGTYAEIYQIISTQ